MNPITNARNLAKMNDRELELGLTGTKQSWHEMYAESAWIFVGGMPYELSEGDVICVFSQYGEIVHINLIRDKDSGKSKGFGFICYEDQRSTILAVDNLNTFKLMGRTLRVDHVKDYKMPKEHEDQDEETKRLQNEGCAPKIEESESGSSSEEDASAIEAKAIRKANRKLEKAQKKKDKELRKTMKKEKKDEGYCSQVKKEKANRNVDDTGTLDRHKDDTNEPGTSKSRGGDEMKYSQSKEFKSNPYKVANDSGSNSRKFRRSRNDDSDQVSRDREHGQRRERKNDQEQRRRHERVRGEQESSGKRYRERSRSYSSEYDRKFSHKRSAEKRDSPENFRERRTRKDNEFRNVSSEQGRRDKRSRSGDSRKHRIQEDRYQKDYQNKRKDHKDYR